MRTGRLPWPFLEMFSRRRSRVWRSRDPQGAELAPDARGWMRCPAWAPSKRRISPGPSGAGTTCPRTMTLHTARRACRRAGIPLERARPALIEAVTTVVHNCRYLMRIGETCARGSRRGQCASIESGCPSASSRCAIRFHRAPWFRSDRGRPGSSRPRPGIGPRNIARSSMS